MKNKWSDIYLSRIRKAWKNIMKPSPKSPAVEKFLDTLTNRTEAIKGNFCVNPPIGCGKEIKPFKDNISKKEYTISGLSPGMTNKTLISP